MVFRLDGKNFAVYQGHAPSRSHRVVRDVGTVSPPPQAVFSWGLSEGRCGKSSRLFTTEWEWDGKVGSTRFLDGTGRDEIVMERVGEIGRGNRREVGRENDRGV